MANKRRSIKSVVKGALDAARANGIEVARIEVSEEGKVVIVTGKNEPEETKDLDQWMARHAH